MIKPYEKPRLDKRGKLQAVTAQSAVSSARDAPEDDGNEDGNDGAGGIT